MGAGERMRRDRVYSVSVGWMPWYASVDEALAALPDPARAAIEAAMVVGWRLVNVYTDRASCMKRGHLQIFVGIDGRVTRPQTKAGLVAQAELHEAGLILRG